MFINIEAERLRHYLSKNKLAVLLEVPTVTLNDWINGKLAIPAEKLRALSRLLGCSVDYLLKERG